MTKSKIARSIPERWLIPLSQVDQNLVLVGQIRNGPGFEFFGRSWSVCPHAGRSPSAPRLAPDCRHAFAGIVAPDDVPVTRRVMVRGEPEHGFERDVPVEAPIVSEDKLVEIGVDVLAAQPMIGAEPPTLHQREDSMNPGQHDMAGHLADRPRVVSVIGEPGIRSVPVGEQRRSGLHVGPHNASIEAAELSGIAARRMRPDRVSRYFARFRLGFAWLVPRSITSTAPAMRIFPDFTGSKKLLSARNGISVWSTSTTPSSGSREGSIIDRRSFCASNQAVLYVMPSWASSWTADMPFECVAMRCAAQNQTVSGNFDRCITVPAVIDVWRPQSRHS